MKKTITVLLISLISILILASCGSDYKSDGGVMNYSMSGGGSASMSSNAPISAPAMDAPMQEMEWGGEYYEDADLAITAVMTSTSNSVSAPDSAPEEGMAEKIIYSLYADIETVAFDETIEKVESLLVSNGAFIESSHIGGVNYAQSYHGLQTHRTANYVIRIPVSRIEEVEASLENLGNVTFHSKYGENITSQFYDTQSRLNSYRIQEERLLDMLRLADNVPDMIAVEQRLAEVRYSIESLTTTLNNWQNRVSYSTLTLNINEVASLTEIIPVQQRTFWQQIGDGLQARTVGVGRFFMDLFKWIVVNLPVLIILAIIVVVIVILVKRSRRRSKERAAEGKGKRKRNRPNPYANPYSNPYANQYGNQNVNQDASQGAQQSADAGAYQAPQTPPQGAPQVPPAPPQDTPQTPPADTGN